MAKYATESDARAAAFQRAAGTCECHGFGCSVPSHPHQLEESALRIGRCTTDVAFGLIDSQNIVEREVANTRVVTVHAHDDATESDNLRVLCAPCAGVHRSATG